MIRLRTGRLIIQTSIAERTISAYQSLAAEVIATAIDDAISTSPSLRAPAEHFLAGDPMLRFWCAVANLDRAQVARMAAEAVRDRRKPPRASRARARAG